MPSGLATVLLATLAASATITACGNTNNTTSAGSTPHNTSSAQASVTASIEAICARRNHATATVDAKKIETEHEFRQAAHKRATIEQTTLDQLHKLTAPATLEPGWRRYLHYKRALIAAWQAIVQHGMLDILGKHREPRIEPVLTAQKSLASTAKQLGLTQCTHEN
jgi:hypothetical protein